MLIYFFIFFLIGVFGELLRLAIKLSWGFVKLFIGIIAFPAILFLLFFKGLIPLAFTALAIIGLVSVIGRIRKKQIE